MRPQPLLKSDIVAVSHELHARAWVANHDGNISVRLPRGRFLCTPTAMSKAKVDESMLVVVDEQGQVVEGTRKVFSEIELHLAIYRARPDAQAIVHAHPPHATAFGVAGVSLEVAAMPEVLVSLGVGVPTVPLHLPKTPELVKAVEETAKKAHAFIVAGNGVWSLGTDLEQAQLRMELVEHYATIVHFARQLGGVKELSQPQIAKMLESRAKAGLEPPGAAKPAAAASGAPAAAPAAPAGPAKGGYPARPAGAGMPPDFEEIAERVAQRLGSAPLAEGELKRLVAQEIRRAIEDEAA